MIELVKVTNFDKLGGLIKQWCLDPTKRPLTLEALKQQLDDAGAEMQIPARIKAVQIIQDQDDILLFRIPSAAMVKGSEEYLKTGGQYTMPLFYRDLFGGRQEVLPDDDAGKMKLQCERIGDYSIGLCM
jgi:hypothetical protein